MSFVPSKDILHRYARVLVDFALNSGQGVKKGEVVRLAASESAKPLLIEVRNQILRSGGIPLVFYQPDDISRDFFELANEEQLKFFPRKYLKGIAEQIDHSIHIISETNKKELEGIDPKRIMARSLALKPFKDWLDAKENQGKFSWTLALFGTEAMAAEARLSLEEYWNQIIKATFIDMEDPVGQWKKVDSEVKRLVDKLNSLHIQRVHIEGEGVDLWLSLGEKRKWLGGSGANIPSFEVFISPDWRGTEGYIEFNQPLYRYGNIIEGIKLKFANGVVVESSALKNYEVLKEMIATPGADRIGEFSLTDKRLSRIDRFMAETLFDENFGGEWGNTHLALGRSFEESYEGDVKTVKKSELKRLGFNDSAVHSDIVSTTRRKVTAYLPDGTEKVIYEDGQFTI